MVRMDPTADASLAAIFARNRLGMAIAAIIRIIATTIKSSISEKPFCLFRMVLLKLAEVVGMSGTALSGVFLRALRVHRAFHPEIPVLSLETHRGRCLLSRRLGGSPRFVWGVSCDQQLVLFRG